MIKEKDYLNNIAEQCLSKSHKLGSTDVSVMVMHSVSEDVSVRNRKLDSSTRSENLGITYPPAYCQIQPIFHRKDHYD